MTTYLLTHSPWFKTNVAVPFVVPLVIFIHYFQLKFFGFFAWTVIQRTVVPLCIFFRFYSTIILVSLVLLL